MQQFQQRGCCFLLQIGQFTFAGYRANMGHHRGSDNSGFLSERSERPTFVVFVADGEMFEGLQKNATQGILWGHDFPVWEVVFSIFIDLWLKTGFFGRSGYFTVFNPTFLARLYDFW